MKTVKKSKLLDITEQEYRALDYCSYSFLSKLDKLDNKVFFESRLPTEALTFGSLVDCVCLTPEDYEDKFFLVKNAPTASTAILAEELVKQGLEINNITEQASDILNIINELELWSKQSDKLKLSKVTDDTIEYVNYYINNIGKTPITIEQQEKASRIQTVLNTHFLTDHIFHPEEMGGFTLKQVKGINTIQGVDYKFMVDLIVVDRENKIIYPYDLKTGMEPILNFATSFKKYRYDIQYYLYSKGVEAIKAELVENGENYTVEPMKFLYIDKNNIELPVIYNVPDTLTVLNGFVSKYGGIFKGVSDLLKIYTYYKENGFVYPKEWTENNGNITLEI